jgi:serine/threonine protein kinase
MLDSIVSMQKRADQSDYAAMNFTQIGDYKFGKHLGAGAYASVKQAVHSATGMITAIKIYDKLKLSNLSRRKSV